MERDGLTLITPRKSKNQWKSGERWFRSMIVADGQVVSVGYPKFFNAEEHQAQAEREQLVRLLQTGDGQAWAEHKMDGSLVIRSVIAGKVIFRTRGTFDGGEMGDVIRKTAEKYPALLDPKVSADGSLLFEFVSSDPRYQVIIRSDVDDLIFLDHVDHTQLRLSDREAKEKIAEEYQLHLVDTHPIAHLGRLSKEVGGWDSEGVVVRFDHGQKLLKVKSRAYLQLHRLKNQMTIDSLQELCEREKIRKPQQFEKMLRKQGADWELLQGSREAVTAYCDALDTADADFERLNDQVDMACVRHPGDNSAVIAELNQTLDGAEREAALLLVDGREAGAAEKLRVAAIEAGLKPFAEREGDLIGELLDES